MMFKSIWLVLALQLVLVLVNNQAAAYDERQYVVRQLKMGKVGKGLKAPKSNNGKGSKTAAPSLSSAPSTSPSKAPTGAPSLSSAPSTSPSIVPTGAPSISSAPSGKDSKSNKSTKTPKSPKRYRF